MRDGVLLWHRKYHSVGETTSRKLSILKVFCHSKAPPFEIDKASDIPPQHTADFSQHSYQSRPPSPLVAAGSAAMDITSGTCQQLGMETAHSLYSATPGSAFLSPGRVVRKRRIAFYPGSSALRRLFWYHSSGWMSRVESAEWIPVDRHEASRWCVIESLEGEAVSISPYTLYPY